jgi:uncharacterized membrane protein
MNPRALLTHTNLVSRKAQILWVAGIAGLLLAAILLTPRLLGAYWLYWGTESFKQLFFEDIGFSESWASTLALPFALAYAFAMLHLVGMSTWRLFSRKLNGTQFAVWFACYIFVFACPQIIRAVASTIQNQIACFDKAGEPIRWYTQDSEGRVLLYNAPGHDNYGAKKQPVTRSICELYQKQQTGDRPKRIVADPRKIEYFDPVTQAPRVWYHKRANSFSLFDAAGFDPIAGARLLPVTPEIVEEILSEAAKAAGPAKSEPVQPPISAPQKAEEPNRQLETVGSQPRKAADPGKHSRLSPEEGTLGAKAAPPPPYVQPKAVEPLERTTRDQTFSSTTSTFQFRVCNNTAAFIAVAVMGHESPTPSDWTLKGWLRVEAGQCREAGSFVKGVFYFAANSPIRRWPGTGSPLCVDAGPFRRVHNSSQQCLPYQRLQSFSRVLVADDRYTANLN